MGFASPAVRRAVAAVAAASAAMAVAAACTSAEQDGADDGVGRIVFADSRDTTRGRQIKRLVDQWNDQNPDERVEMVELPENSDDQRAQLVAHAQDASADRDEDASVGPDVCYDVISIDIVRTAEFARWGYIVPLSRREFDADAFLPRPIEGASYNGKLWGIPLRSDVGLLYYRKDVLDRAGARVPTSWAELRRQAMSIAPANNMAGYVTQLGAYEGFTVNAMEAFWDTGAEVLGPDGEILAEPSALRPGISRLAQGVAEGWIPQEALTFNEEGARSAFQDGSVLFMRNWTYAYQVLNSSGSRVAGRFGVAPLPMSSSLGGWNLAVSRCSRHRATARRFIKFLTGFESQRTLFTQTGVAPTRKALYDNPQLQRAYPHLAILRTSIDRARTRPVTPYYDQVSSTIQSRLRRAVTDPKVMDRELAALRTDMLRAADGR
ncbi:ABC transporter substrate-binding protein [Actinomadura rubrobrunea]|uniref:ABC transporter substrate-binding protein n=1 Tax=Actinomadura rubrobrunea TaxID=115335 RepID=A0A9W6UUI9_9ACTN|nr:ABC transporter substrate-binding protein [Actinomadura rubrobrunea]GLW64681.1 ABC transporter substrate-binding protein [Actinomadura rubrobrunea]